MEFLNVDGTKLDLLHILLFSIVKDTSEASNILVMAEEDLSVLVDLVENLIPLLIFGTFIKLSKH